MIRRLNHKGKMTECFYTEDDIERMFFRETVNTDVIARIDAKMQKTRPWAYVTINGRQMIAESEKNRIVGEYEKARQQVKQEIGQERQDYLAKMYPNIDPKFRGMFA